MVDVYPGGRFQIRTDEGLAVLAHLSGRLRIRRIRVVLGDRVTVEIPLRTPERGRITYRHR